ncbi:MAG: hypothetical protein GEV06_22230 [Luteitalea sp.]|nr:hypothetical protein [Luteitalea sp.]
MNNRSFLLALALVVALCMPSVALATNDDGGSQSASILPVAEYVDVSAYLTEPADIDAWYTMIYNLKQNFDYICGDTFCEGEYTNIESLRYRCSVEGLTGTIGSCVWVFAASNEEVSPSTGKIIVDVGTWRCRSPIVRGTSIHDLLSALAGPSPLYATLPETDRSIYDGLVTCL